MNFISGYVMIMDTNHRQTYTMNELGDKIKDYKNNKYKF